MTRDRNNFRAGLFVLTGLVLAFAMVVMISNFQQWFTGKQKVTVRYHLSDGLRGLKEGAVVTIGDVPAGQVVDIRAVETDGVVTHMDVTFTLPRKYKLYDNAVIELKQPALGENTKLNIQSFGRDGGPGRKTGPSWEYEPGEVIAGGIAGSHLTASAVHDLGIDDLQRQQIRNIIANLSDLSDQLNGKQPGPVAETLDNLRLITGQLSGKAETGRFYELLKHLADSAGRLDTILSALAEGVEMDQAAVRQFLPTLGRTAADLRQITSALAEGAQSDRDALKRMLPNLARFSEDLATATDDLKQVMDALGDGVQADPDVFKDLLANLKKASADIAQVTAKVRQETIGKIHAALDKANAAMDDIKDSTDNLKTLLASQRPVLERTLANARLVSDQLKLAAIEIRRSPWRLLYEPDDKELDTDNLYDAARSFALAAGTLDNTAESLRVLVERYGDKLDANDQRFKAMLETLRQTFEKYTEAEKKFWQAIEQQEKR